MIEARHTNKTAVMPLVRKSDDRTYKQAPGKAYWFKFGMMKAVHTSVQSPHPEMQFLCIHACTDNISSGSKEVL